MSFYSLFPRHSVPLISDKPSMTKQAFADDSDINVIMARFAQTGSIELHKTPPHFGNDPSLSLSEAMNIVLDAEEEFSNLPSRVREDFGNDPAQLADFVTKNGLEAFEERAQAILRPSKPVVAPVATTPLKSKRSPQKAK